MMIAGIDDAGRGAIIGPLVIAGVLIEDHRISNFDTVGVKDSKALTPNRRAVLSPKIKKLVLRWEILEISPYDIDQVVLEGRKFRKLNWLEATTMAEVIKKLRPEIAYVDASDIDETRFATQIKEALPFEITIVSKHHADAKYPVVSAASIIAKVHRDEVVALLRERYGNFGSGYTSDPRTKEFLLNWIKEEKALPNFIRKSWKTINQLKVQIKQQKLL